MAGAAAGAARAVTGAGAAAGAYAGTGEESGAGTGTGAGAGAGTAADAAPEAPGSPTARFGFRGVWIATVFNRDWPSRTGLTAEAQRAELLAHLDTAVERRLNAVVLQVRPTADALWPSPYEPWTEFLTGTQGRDPGWDPLGTAVEEAHARGLELHAWFNPYRVANHPDPARLVAGHPARLHPEWVLPYGGKLYYDPGLPEVRRFTQDAMLDALLRYDIDAVHWDDYFYPYPVAGEAFADDGTYARYGADFPDKASWRRNNTDLLVSEMSVRIKAAKPHVAFGVSPFGVWRNIAEDPEGSDTRAGVATYDDLYADTRKWIREGWIDYVVPQLYWHIGLPAADYATLLPWWDAVVRGTGVALYIGEALYKAGDPAQPAAWQDPRELSRHLDLAADRAAVGGHCFFSALEVAKDPIGAMATVVADHYPTRVRAPGRG
ncbi:family 10 glycosylhydrolase [Streptomyces sp. TX20-6-3]|uniref:glycoside hydrolase family 10 protein n=1 Tax=Streptomyces sp. TX20-6-3 TaxID=3028705 RepID=UPI0029B9A0AC|nr:family 10 glycosylhydrolase [Streptomyces sp. TX20-6-3]MDX2563455.1 family 10 glycosylhydrolase [Streptomyces sp. TX20-6-3]